MPKEWENSFKLVHQCLLMAGLQVEHWLKATHEMYHVVVPGGWVQLRELKLAGFKNICIEHRSIPLSGWGSRNSQEAMVNWIEVFWALKTPTLNGGGFGYINSESEFDKMINEVEQEWDQLICIESQSTTL
ncbi:hypothetical protein BDQ17DRAFT_1327997 [Cyathus striatus]|nr:hypothetical protein BDQ17DRAFT_1327997 [Cyathus striatus]